MKKIFCITLLAALFACNTKTPSMGYKIFGNLSHLPDGPVVLKQLINGEWKGTDTTYSQSGTFTFEGKLNIPEMFRIVISDTLPYISLFADNNEITLSGTLDSLKNVRISGSKAHEEYEAFWGSLKPYRQKLDSIGDAYDKAEKAGNEPLLAKIDSSYNVISGEEAKVMKQFTLSHKSSVISTYIAWSQLVHSSSLYELDSIVSGFDTVLNRSTYVQLLKKHIETLKKVEIGQPATDFTMNTPDGTPLTLSSLYGSYLLIDFWASWCPPCRKENPAVVAVYKKYHKKGFDVLGVSLDKKKSDWMKAIKADKLTWNHVSDLKFWSNEAGKLYAIRSIPSNVLLDKKGIIIAKNLYGKELENKLKELMKK
jgi:peroxiredoxin